MRKGVTVICCARHGPSTVTIPYTVDHVQITELEFPKFIACSIWDIWAVRCETQVIFGGGALGVTGGVGETCSTHIGVLSLGSGCVWVTSGPLPPVKPHPKTLKCGRKMRGGKV